MPAVSAHSDAIEQIKNSASLVDVSSAESIELTPVLVLAVSLLYMMSSDGQVEEEESSQLQSVIGGNADLLSYAVAYVQRVPIQEFLKKAPTVLSTQDKLCILTNVCDSMLSDGRREQAELELLEKMQKAFGVSTETFKPYYKVIQLKNDKTVLGPFEPIQAGPAQLTPHLALAAALLYMMSADGSLGQEEIGQLETVIGEFEGLQRTALGYVRAVKREQFFKQAAPVLSKKQKLCVLSNVCDSMMSDGVVAVVEDKLFLSMMTSFGLRIKDFDQFQKVLETKNFKPFDVSKFENKTSHDRAMGGAAAEGQVFDMSTEESALGDEVRRTMHDNIERVQQDFGSEAAVSQVNHNAIDDLNIQSVDEVGKTTPNIQAIDAGALSDNVQNVGIDVMAPNMQAVTDGQALQADQQASAMQGAAAHVQGVSEGANSQANKQVLATQGATANIQGVPEGASGQANIQPVATDAVAPNTQWLHGQAPAANQASVQVAGHAAARVPIDTAVAGPNVQEIGADKLAANRQALAGLSALATNRQPLGADSDGDHLEALPPEVRVEQLYQTIESLKDQLDRFESKNKKILAAVRQAKQVQEKQKSESESLQDTVALLPVDIPKSAEGVAKSPLTANIQAVGAEVLTTNVQDIGAEVYALNRQTLAPTEPRQPVDLSSPAPPLVPHAQQALTVTVASAEGLHMAAELLPTLTEEASPVASAVSIKAPSSKAKRLQRAHSGRGHPFKIYVRVAATFVVLSCWTSNIAAIDRLYPQRVTGKLETLSPSQSWVETTVLQAPDI